MTNYVECSRLFGTLASAKRVSGRVKEVIPGLQKDGRRKTDLRVAWVIKTKTVEKTLALRSVKAGPPPALAAPPPSHGLEGGSPVTQASQTRVALHGGGQPPPPPPPSVVASAGGAISAAPTLPPSTATAHGLTWTAGAVHQPVGGPVARRSWSVRTLPWKVMHEDGDSAGPGQMRTPYDYFP